MFKQSPKIPSVKLRILDTPAGEPLPSLSDITRSASSIINMEFLWSIKNGMIVGSDNISAIDGGMNKISLSFTKLVKCLMYEVLPVPGSPCKRIIPLSYSEFNLSTITSCIFKNSEP